MSKLDMLNCMDRYALEEKEKWRDFIKTMPEIQFPTDWKVKIIPPFGGAMARFIVRLPSGNTKSVYFDAYMRLGYWEGPYWEVYPVQGDVGRCDAQDVAKLLELVTDESEPTP